MESILELRDLVKLFPNQRAVDGISLKIARGGFYSLLGPSGCGKTTTLRLIAGFEQPTSGEVLLDGAVVNEQKPYQRNVSTVFQNYALFPHLTAAENIAFGLKRKNQPDIERRVREALELVRRAINHGGHRVVATLKDFAVVHQEGVGDCSEARESFVVVDGNRLDRKSTR